jgi:hypothetical protein
MTVNLQMARVSDLTTIPSKPLNKQIDYPSPESLPINIGDGRYQFPDYLWTQTSTNHA